MRATPIALLPLLGAFQGSGRELITHTGDYTIQNWQLEQGLPQTSVTSIAQTPDGYLWVATFNGLGRFDGVRFTVFTDRNVPTLGNSAITQLQVDRQGALWIVTLAGGLVRMAAGQFTTILKDHARFLLSEPPSSREAGSGLFIIDDHGEARRIATGQVLPMTSPAEANSAPTPRLLFESTCLSWVAEGTRIVRSHLTSFAVSPGQAPTSDLAVRITSAVPSQSGGYWVATTNGLHRLQQGRLSSRVAPLPARVSEQLTLQEDGQGHLWAGLWGEGLFRLDANGSWHHFSVGSALADDHVTCLFRDREGSLWVGTGQGGLHRIGQRVFQVYDTETGPNVIMSVTQDRQDRMWFGVNGGGLHGWSAGKLRPVTTPAALRSPLSYSVLVDRQGTLWVGLYGKTALQWQAESVTLHDLSEGSPEEMTANALFEDRAGVVWLGCTHGLLRWEKGRFTRYAARDGLTCETVLALAEDRSGTLYVGSDGGGLYGLRDGRFTSWSEQDGLADDHVSSLWVDREDVLWIGTANGGLGRFKDGRFSTVGIKDGLPTETIGTLLEDDSGHLWLGSNRGIIRVSRTALNEYMDRKRRAVAWHVFGLSDGLTTLGCAGGSQPGSCKARDGKLWFSSIKGVAVVEPARIPFNPLPPPVVIEEVWLDELSVAGRGEAAGGGQVVVPPRTRRVEFRFTGLSLRPADQVRFRFRLEPFEPEWVDAGTRRFAYYTGIPPGHYEFRVSACNSDGVWNDAGARLGLVVRPRWWQTRWFWVSAIASAAVLVLFSYERRIHWLRRRRALQEAFSRRLLESQEEERQRVAAELHDSLGQDLLVIKNRALLGLQEPAPAESAEHLQEISRLASQTLEEVREISRNLRPYQIDRLGLTQALRGMVTTVVRSSGIQGRIEVASVDGLLPPQHEIHLYRTVQEMLNNVVKHADASQLQVTIHPRERGGIALRVEDDGRGFDYAAARERGPRQGALGLAGIAERVRLLGGSLRCDSHPGHGTRWLVEIPVNPQDRG